MASIWKTVGSMVDENARATAEWLKKKLHKLRFLRFVLTMGIMVSWLAAVAALLLPEYSRYALALGVLATSLALFYLHTMLSFPFQAKSIVRLIELGYPANVREMGVRVVARKLRDESIETEDMLVETAWNESKKAYRKYKERAQELARRLDEDIAARRGDGQQ